MSSRLALESWQLLFPAIGLGIFAAIFFGVVVRVWRMPPPRVEHMGYLPLAEESVAGSPDSPPESGAGAPPASIDRHPAPCHLMDDNIRRPVLEPSARHVR